MTINIIGAGIAGSIMAKMLLVEGFQIRIFDDHDDKAGSRASSNIYIAHWINKFTEKGKLGLEQTEFLFGHIADNPFSDGLSYAANVKHVSNQELLEPPTFDKEVLEVKEEGVVDSNFDLHKGPTVICTGYRGAQLAPEFKVDILVGHAFYLRGVLPKELARLTLASPYVHQKCYQLRPNVIYFADSVALKPEAFEARKKEVYDRSIERMKKAGIGDFPISSYRIGYRPIMKDHTFCCAERIPGKKAWFLNGGGRHGLVAYAYGAKKILEEIKCL